MSTLTHDTAALIVRRILIVIEEPFFDICEVDGVFAAKGISGLTWLITLSKTIFESLGD